MAKSAPARHLSMKYPRSASSLTERGCPSGKAATPTQKSPDSLIRRTSSAAYRRPSGCGTHSSPGAPGGDGVVDRGEVPDRRERVLFSDPAGGPHGPVPGRAARAIGHGDKRRSQWLQLADGPPELFLVSLGLGRHELEGAGPDTRGKKILDSGHGCGHAAQRH